MIGIVLACLGVALLLPGCGKPGSGGPDAPPAGEPAVPEDPVGRVFMRADELLAAGQTNAAITALQGGLDDPQLAPHRRQIFNGLIRFLLMTGRLEEAKARMRTVYRDDAELAQGGLGLVYNHLAEQGRLDEVVAWTEEVLAIDALPVEVRRNMREWNLLAYVNIRDDEKMASVIEQFLKEAPAGGVVGMISRACDLLFDQQRLDSVARIMRLAAGTLSSDEETQQLLLFTRLRLLAAQTDWSGLQSALPKAAERLTDSHLQRLLRLVLPALVKAGKTEICDTLCGGIVAAQNTKPQSFSVAARQWTDNAMAFDPAALPVRLEALLRAKLPSRQLCGIYMRHFYDLIDNRQVMESMKGLGERLAPLADDDETRNHVRTMVLDASFVLEDYDTALRMLQAGIAKRDAAWHEMAISKVKAHKALKEEQPREAVKHFRAFMATVVNAKEEDTSDPTTGLVHSKEMILGRNAKRIGDIVAAIPDAEAARQAYAEARDYYATALKGAKEPAVKEIVEREMAEVPRP
jgi:tetratricopeptide (TPR) repeat protein